MMRLSAQRFQRALQARQGFKVISGIANFDVESVLTLVRAAKNACHMDGLAVDVAAAPEIVKAVRAEFEGMVFASSVVVSELVAAVEAGADGVELGNFDALYAKGYYIDAAEVLTLAQETVKAIAGRAMVCVTVPGHLTVEAQVKLAQELEVLGVDLIQTEGAARLLSQTPQVKSLSAAEKAEMTVSNAHALANAVSIPVMAASGMAADTVAAARVAGAAAVGIGSAVNKLASQNDMETALSGIAAAWAVEPVLVSQAV